ncbi:unnamed protein product [Boreogadus saida]
MENIGGIFVVLICGLILAVFVAVMEFVWSTRHSGSDEVSVCQEMMSEFRNAVSCRKSSRSRRRRPLTGSAGGGVLRPRPRPRPLRLVRDVRFSNGQLCGLGGGFGPPGGALDPWPGPHRLLVEDPLGADVGPPAPPPAPLAPPPAAKPLLPMLSAPRWPRPRWPPGDGGGGGGVGCRMKPLPPPRPLPPPAKPHLPTDLLGGKD